MPPSWPPRRAPTSAIVHARLARVRTVTSAAPDGHALLAFHARVRHVACGYVRRMPSKCLSSCFVAVSAAIVLAATSALVPVSAHAAVPDAQPTSTAYPQHASYVYGSDAEPYAAS